MRRLALSLCLAGSAWAAPPGLREADYPLHALTHAKIYVTPDRVLEDATLIVENGTIRQLGTNLEVPAGARVWNCQGKVIHAGFIDPFLGSEEAQNEAREEKSEASGRGDELRAAGGGGSNQEEEEKPPALAADRQVKRTSSSTPSEWISCVGWEFSPFKPFPRRAFCVAREPSTR